MVLATGGNGLGRSGRSGGVRLGRCGLSNSIGVSQVLLPTELCVAGGLAAAELAECCFCPFLYAGDAATSSRPLGRRGWCERKGKQAKGHTEGTGQRATPTATVGFPNLYAAKPPRQPQWPETHEEQKEGPRDATGTLGTQLSEPCVPPSDPVLRRVGTQGRGDATLRHLPSPRPGRSFLVSASLDTTPFLQRLEGVSSLRPCVPKAFSTRPGRFCRGDATPKPLASPCVLMPIRSWVLFTNWDSCDPKNTSI